MPTEPPATAPSTAQPTALNLKETVLLPKTGLEMRANLREAEVARLKKWEQIGLELKLRAKSRGRQRFILHDGPPYANGPIHIGHAVNKVLKDVVVRYRTMAGFDSLYVPGWDCHGLPIEQRALKDLGPAALKASPMEIRRYCADEARKWIDVQRMEFKRLLIGGQWETPYLTMAPEYEVGILAALKAIVERGLVYRALRPVYWDAVYRTALAEAEIIYETTDDPSIYVSFPLVDPAAAKGLDLPAGTAVAIWTTTPWTIPGNVAVCLGPTFTYCLVRATLSGDGGTAHYIVARDLAESFARECRFASWEVEREFPATPLVGLTCTHPILNRTSRILVGDHVTLEQGTGCVHTASGHGHEDFEICQKHGIEVVQPLDDGGHFIPGYFPPDQMTNEMAELEGVAVLADKFGDSANGRVIELLKRRGVLIASRRITHEYPHSWRSRRPIIFRATEQWFMAVDKDGVRDRCLDLIDTSVQWIPKWGRERIVGMVKNRPDWCLSRQRAWGVPIPAFASKTTGKPFLDPRLIDHFAGIVAREGTDAWWTRDVADLLPKNYVGPNGERAADLEKTWDVLDVWFDSGSSSIAVCEQNPELGWPVDLYLEGSDQHRGWFQTSLLVAAGARNAAPYRAVLTHGFVLDGKGRAMSKSLGNVIAPQEVIEKHGADILRLWVVAEDYRGDMMATMERYTQLTESYRRIRNTLRFLCGNLHGYDAAAERVAPEAMTELDRLALHRLHAMVEDVRGAYEEYEFHRAVQVLTNYCAVELGAFYLDVLKDRLYCDAASSARRRSARTVMFEIAHAIARLMAPIMPHTADEVWENLPGTDGVESVHLADMPEAPAAWRDEALAARWETLLAIREHVMKALEAARKKRDEAPTAERFIGNALEAAVVLDVRDAERAELVRRHAADLAEMFIVSAVRLESLADGAPRVVVPADDPALRVLVVRADGSKCERCWRTMPTVGQDQQFTTVCDRCAEVIRKDYAS